MAKMEYICGVNAVLEAFRAGRRKVYGVMAAEGRKEPRLAMIREMAEEQGIRVRQVDRKDIARHTRTDGHQGIVAEVEPFEYADADALIRDVLDEQSDAIFLILDGITDPHNLGAIIRTAHLMGVRGVFLPKDNAADISPVVAKAASGALEYIALAKITNVVSTINDMKSLNIWVVGAEGESPKSVYDYDWRGPHAVVMGAEGRGLRRLVAESCDTLLTIPMAGMIDSFNVSVATGIFLSQAHQSRLKSVK